MNYTHPLDYFTTQTQYINRECPGYEAYNTVTSNPQTIYSHSGSITANAQFFPDSSRPATTQHVLIPKFRIGDEEVTASEVSEMYNKVVRMYDSLQRDYTALEEDYTRLRKRYFDLRNETMGESVYSLHPNDPTKVSLKGRSIKEKNLRSSLFDNPKVSGEPSTKPEPEEPVTKPEPDLTEVNLARDRIFGEVTISDVLDEDVLDEDVLDEDV